MTWSSLHVRGHTCIGGSPGDLQGEGGRGDKRQERTHEDGGGGEVTRHCRAETAAWSFDCSVPDNVSVGPAGGAWARSNSSGGEEVAGSRVGELLEEGGEGALTGLCPGLECLSYRLWQA